MLGQLCQVEHWGVKMGLVKQELIAMEFGSQHTLYAICKAMGIPLTESQVKAQEYFEKKYPAYIARKQENRNGENQSK